MRSYLVDLDALISAWDLIYIPTFCVWAAMAGETA